MVNNQNIAQIAFIIRQCNEYLYDNPGESPREVKQQRFRQAGLLPNTPATMAALALKTGISDSTLQRMANEYQWQMDGCPTLGKVSFSQLSEWVEAIETVRQEVADNRGYKWRKVGDIGFNREVRSILDELDYTNLPVACHWFRHLTDYSIKTIEELQALFSPNNTEESTPEEGKVMVKGLDVEETALPSERQLNIVFNNCSNITVNIHH